MRATLGAPWLRLVLWIAFLLLRVDGWGVFDGVPLRSVEVSALAAGVLVWRVRGALPGGTWLPALAVLLKLAAISVVVPQGFVARYYANDSWAPPYERSVEYPRSPFTRIDRRLQFDTPAGPHLPLFFFNDNTRFNYYGAEPPGRGELPFSIQWDGYLWAQASRQATVVVRGSGLETVLRIENNPALSKTAADESVAATVSLQRGWQHVIVRVKAPSGRARSFEVTGLSEIYSRRMSPAALWWNRGARLVGSGVDVALLAILAWAFVNVFAGVVNTLLSIRGRQFFEPTGVSAILIFGSAIAFTDALAFARVVDGRLLLYSGGNDMLTYETFSRDIAINGPLMLLGQPLGHATPFYFQPFYPYCLAIVHLVFGEDAFGVLLVQRLGLWIALFALASTTRRLFGDTAAVGALMFGGVFFYAKVLRWSSVLLAEVLFMPLTCLCLSRALALAAGGGIRDAIATGVLGGLTTLVRSTFATAWVLVMPLVALARRRAGFSLTAVLLSIAVLTSVVGLATLRNWIASGTFVPIASSGPVVLLLGNPPPPGTPLGSHEHSIFHWIAVDERTRIVMEGALHQPVAFSTNLLRKALYTLGFFAAYIPGSGSSPLLTIAWSLALLGLLGRRDAFSRDPRGLVGWLPAVFAATHFAAVTIFVPHVYGDRLILPFYVLLIPYVGSALSLVVEALRPLAARQAARRRTLGSSRSSSAHERG